MRTAKQSKVKTVSRGCLTGRGESITESKADLSWQVDQALEGSYDPFLLTLGENTILAWRSPHGWNYKILRDSERETGIHQISAGTMGGTDVKDFIQSAAYHILDLENHDYHSIEEIPGFLTDPSLRRDLYHKSCWMRAYQWAKDHKPEGRDSDHQWHEWACWNSHNPEFA